VIAKVFIDSDVLIDIATEREPFFPASQAVFSLAESGVFLAYTSPNSITNIYYILTKLSSASKARVFIRKTLEIVRVADVDHDSVLQALESKFFDFEDGVQNYCALRNRCDYIITRNIRDYEFSEIRVLDPKEMLLLHKKNT